MLQPIALQGDTELRALEIAVSGALESLLSEDVPRFTALGMRSRRPGQEVRAFSQPATLRRTA